MLGFKLHASKGQYPPWRRLLEAKIKAAWREVSHLSELERGKTTKVLKNYSKFFITKALETAKWRLTGLAARLMRYTRDFEARRINRMFTLKQSKVYS